MCIKACCEIEPEIKDVYEKALDSESSQAGKGILSLIIENADIAGAEKIPACQDTGMTVVFVEIGEEVNFKGPSLKDAINEGVRDGYVKGFLRKSIVVHPLDRKNTGDNTPAVIYFDMIKGEKVKIVYPLDEPSKGRIYSFGNNWGLSAIIYFVGAIALFLGIMGTYRALGGNRRFKIRIMR